MTPISKTWKLLDFYGSLLPMVHYNCIIIKYAKGYRKTKKKQYPCNSNVEFVHDTYTKIKCTKLALGDATTHTSKVEEIVVVFDNNIFF